MGSKATLSKLLTHVKERTFCTLKYFAYLSFSVYIKVWMNLQARKTCLFNLLNSDLY